MAEFAVVRRLDVRRVLSGRVSAVMAVDAVSGDIDVVEIRRKPRHSRVAVITVVATLDVILRLAGGDNAIVTGAALTDDLGMVNRIYRCENVRRVAVLANVRRLDVCCVLPGRIRSVVTVEAITRDVHVIEIGRQPSRRRVTIVAIVSTGNVIGRLARCRGAVVA